MATLFLCGFAAPSLAQISPAPEHPAHSAPGMAPGAVPLPPPASPSLAQAEPKATLYQPLPIKSGILIEDSLTTQDIPMGQGSFARDYVISLKAGAQIAIDLTSDNFDPVVVLMSENGATLGENDDGPDGSTNSLLFMRITQDGSYTVRVRGFGQAKGGAFKLRLTQLQAATP